MPYLPISDSPEAPFDELGCLTVIAHMCYPRDEARRHQMNRLVIKEKVRAALIRGESPTIEANIIAIETDGSLLKGISEAINFAITPAELAGKQLRLVHDDYMYSGGVQGSLTRAQQGVFGWAKAKKVPRAGITAIRAAWQDFKPTAHIWAAIDGTLTPGHEEWYSHLTSPSAMKLLLAISEYYISFAENYQTTIGGQQIPLIKAGTAWRPPPDFPLPDIEPLSLANDTGKAIKLIEDRDNKFR